MSHKPITLNDPKPYFDMLDQVSANHWWARGVECIERHWLRKALFSRKQPIGQMQLNWLDIGSGTGDRMRRWSDWNCWAGMIGAEPERAALVTSNTLPFQQVQSGWPGLPFGPSVFHLITAFDVIQHVSASRRLQAIQEAGRLLKPGGLLLVRTNGSCFKRRDDSIVAAGELRDWLQLAGLRLVRDSHFNMTGGIIDEMTRRLSPKNKSIHKMESALKTGLPQQWRARPQGHWAARFVGGLESRISAFGLAKIPVGHSYIVLATKDEAQG